MLRSLLVTGGSGLLGLNWAMVMRERCTVVLALHRRGVSLAGVMARAVRLDSGTELADVLRAVRPDVVVHAAGMTSVEACEAAPDRARYVNVEIAARVAEHARRHGCRFVHISTDHLFGGTNGVMSEDTPVAPTNVYGRTKAEAETRVLETCPETIVVRTNFYGWGPRYRPSFSDTILQALRGRSPLTLFADVFYTPILTDVLVTAVHELVDHGAAGVFNVAGDDRVSKHEFGVRLATHFNLDASLINAGSLDEHSGLVQRPHHMSLSNRKLVRVLGRSVGGVDEHLETLRRQEECGRAREIRAL